MIALEFDCGIVPSSEIVAAAVDLYVGNPQYDASVGDNQNKLILPEIIVQMTLQEMRLKV